MITTQKTLDAIERERSYQRSQWDLEHDRQHTPGEWAALVAIYTGKLAEAVINMPFFTGGREEVRRRLVQVAAICCAALDAMVTP